MVKNRGGIINQGMVELKNSIEVNFAIDNGQLGFFSGSGTLTHGLFEKKIFICGRVKIKEIRFARGKWENQKLGNTITVHADNLKSITN